MLGTNAGQQHIESTVARHPSRPNKTVAKQPENDKLRNTQLTSIEGIHWTEVAAESGKKHLQLRVSLLGEV